MFDKLFGGTQAGKDSSSPVVTLRHDAAAEPEVVDAEFVETITSRKEQMSYTGQVIACQDGYSFIDHVKRGYETINTGGDVFVPQTFQVGTFVEFDSMSPDPKREGKFRTETARIINSALVTVGGQRMALDLYQQMTTRQIYHVNAKRIDPAEAEKAAENAPFIDVLGAKIQMGDQVDVTQMAEQFLRGLFANLQSIGVSYSITGDVNLDEEAKLVEEAKNLAREMGMDGQAESITKEYDKFVGIRQAFTLMNQHCLLSLESVIPLRNLPDLLVACPVWFFGGKQIAFDQVDKHPDNLTITNTHLFFCNAMGTKEFGWLFQLYNRRIRPFNRFSGRDIIPLPIARLMKEANKTFDHLVIATPYHDIASTEWNTPWPRNVDPFLIGFMEGIDYMFLLGRWSGTGLFPLVCDMVADTMDHLRANKHALDNIPGYMLWWSPIKGDPWAIRGHLDKENNNNTVLEPFVDQVLAAYEQRRLFAFLRGEDSGTTH